MEILKSSEVLRLLRAETKDRLGHFESVNLFLGKSPPTICCSLGEFDDACNVINTLKYIGTPEPDKHANIIALRQQLSGKHLPTLGEIFQYGKPRIKEPFQEAMETTFAVAQERLQTGKWKLDKSSAYLATREREEKSFIATLMLECYGIFLAKYFGDQRLAQMAPLAFKEVLYIVKPTDRGELYEEYGFDLGGAVIDQMVQEREQYPPHIRNKLNEKVFLDTASQLLYDLPQRYEEFKGKRVENPYRDECRGALNFTKTLEVVVKHGWNLEATEKWYKVLEALAKWPNAGNVAWELRKALRRIDKDSMIALAEEMSRVMTKYPQGIRKNERYLPLINGEEFFWEGEQGEGVDQLISGTIEYLKSL